VAEPARRMINRSGLSSEGLQPLSDYPDWINGYWLQRRCWESFRINRLPLLG
jgi:hypothetical protein